MLFRVQSLCLRRIVLYENRIYSSSTAPRSDKDWEQDEKNKNETKDKDEDEASIASMIGPYISSKQIAFHTGQFDSEHIQKKNKQAFLVCIFFIFKFWVLKYIFRMLLKHIKFNFQIVVVMSNLFELLFDV
jgi:valyl-tRNA synthetase